MAHILQFLMLEASVWPSRLLGLTKLLLVQQSRETTKQVGRQALGSGLQVALRAAHPVCKPAWWGVLQETSWCPLILHNWEPPEVCVMIWSVSVSSPSLSPDPRPKAPWGQRQPRYFCSQSYPQDPVSLVPGTQKALINRAHLRTSSNLQNTDS